MHNMTEAVPAAEQGHYVRSVSGTWHIEVNRDRQPLDQRAETDCHRLVKPRDRAIGEFEFYNGMDICCECRWPEPRPWRRSDRPVRRRKG